MRQKKMKTKAAENKERERGKSSQEIREGY